MVKLVILKKELYFSINYLNMLIITRQISHLLFSETSLFVHPTNKYILLLILSNQYLYSILKNIKFILMKDIKYKIKLMIFKNLYKRI